VPEASGTDCSLGGRIQPQIAWAKLRTLHYGRGNREQEVAKSTSKVPVQDERKKARKV
jgi:hypothetical protein